MLGFPNEIGPSIGNKERANLLINFNSNLINIMPKISPEEDTIVSNNFTLEDVENDIKLTKRTMKEIHKKHNEISNTALKLLMQPIVDKMQRDAEEALVLMNAARERLLNKN